MTDSYHTYLALQKDNTLYKFIWVQSGSLRLEIDHVPTTLVKGEIIPLTPLHHIEFKAINGEYLTLLFNSNFYCIFGHDNEVSCNGFLFNGTSNVMQLKLSESQVASLRDITDELCDRFGDPPSSVNALIQVALLRGEASQQGVADISQKGGAVRFTFAAFDFARISALYAKPDWKGRVKVEAGGKPAVTLRLASRRRILEEARAFIRDYAATAEQ